MIELSWIVYRVTHIVGDNLSTGGSPCTKQAIFKFTTSASSPSCKLLRSNHTHRNESPPLQKGFGQFVHGFAGEIVDNSGIEGVTAAVANVSTDNSRGNNASGGTGTGAGGAGEDGG